MNRSRAVVVALVGFVVACNQNAIVTPIRSFDRPTDVALGCARFDPSPQNLVFNADSIENCAPDRVQALTVTDANGTQFAPQLRALVVNSTRGELAVVDVNSGRIVDLDPRRPGFGFLPVGRLTEHVRTSRDGCWAVTTNADSCDISLVDLPVLYNLPFLPYRSADGGAVDDAGHTPLTVPANYGENVVRKIVPMAGTTPLEARPAWVEWAPESTAAIHGYEPGGEPGQCKGGTPLAWVALPSCELVVEIDLAHTTPDGNGRLGAPVVRAVRTSRSAYNVITDPAQLQMLTCAAECSGTTAADGGAGLDLATTDASTSLLPDTQSFPSVLAVDDDASGARLVVGDAWSERLLLLPLDRTTGAVGAGRELRLADGASGVNALRVSSRTAAGKFLYAVARDATVRVVDLDRETECETNPDPRYLRASVGTDPMEGVERLGCFPLGDPATPPRSALFPTPGITFPNGAIPSDVSFVRLNLPLPPDPQLSPPVAAPGLMIGDFAWIFASNGRAVAVNIYDACPAPNVPQGAPGAYTPACSLANAQPSRDQVASYPGPPVVHETDRTAHQIRVATNRYIMPGSCTDTIGSARLKDENNPETFTYANSVGTITSPDAGVLEIPHLVSQSVAALPNALCPTMKKSLQVFDPNHMPGEVWSVAWEGLLPGTTRNFGRVTAAGKLEDAGAFYCARDVRAGDVVQLNGCLTDSDCSYTQACVFDPNRLASVQTGLCLDRDPARQAAARENCRALLQSTRRYRIVSAQQEVPLASGGQGGLLALGELYEPEHVAETHSCVADAECADVVVAGPIDATGNPAQLPTRCLLDNDGQKRCLRSCQKGAVGIAGLCGNGYVCADSVLRGDTRCMRAPLDERQARPLDHGGWGCLDQFQPYQVYAGNTFVISGSISGAFVASGPDPVTHECQQVDTTKFGGARLLQSRIPLTAAECTGDIFDPLLPSAPTTVGYPNVCQKTTGPTRQIHYENPYFAIGLLLPPLPAVPPDQFTLQFEIIAGAQSLFARGSTSSVLGVDVPAQLLRAAVVAPDQATVYVIDEGKQTTATGVRGQLFRLLSGVQSVDTTFLIR